MSFMSEAKDALELLKDIVTTVKELKMLRPLEAALLGGKDDAKKELAEALKLIEQVHHSIRDGFLRLIGIDFAKAEGVKDARIFLNNISTVGFTEAIGGARGNCSKIWDIYNKHLSGWFYRQLKADDFEKVRELFVKLGHPPSKQETDDDRRSADQKLMACLGDLDKALSREADRILRMIEGPQPDLTKAANAVAEIRRTLREPVQQLQEAAATVQELKAIFV